MFRRDGQDHIYREHLIWSKMENQYFRGKSARYVWCGKEVQNIQFPVVLCQVLFYNPFFFSKSLQDKSELIVLSSLWFLHWERGWSLLREKLCPCAPGQGKKRKPPPPHPPSASATSLLGVKKKKKNYRKTLGCIIKPFYLDIKGKSEPSV